jgi:hypothetical protein
MESSTSRDYQSLLRRDVPKSVVASGSHPHVERPNDSTKLAASSLPAPSSPLIPASSSSSGRPSSPPPCTSHLSGRFHCARAITRKCWGGSCGLGERTRIAPACRSQLQGQYQQQRQQQQEQRNQDGIYRPLYGAMAESNSRRSTIRFRRDIDNIGNALLDLLTKHSVVGGDPKVVSLAVSWSEDVAAGRSASG